MPAEVSLRVFLVAEETAIIPRYDHIWKSSVCLRYASLNAFFRLAVDAHIQSEELKNSVYLHVVRFGSHSLPLPVHAHPCGDHRFEHLKDRRACRTPTFSFSGQDQRLLLLLHLLTNDVLERTVHQERQEHEVSERLHSTRFLQVDGAYMIWAFKLPPDDGTSPETEASFHRMLANAIYLTLPGS